MPPQTQLKSANELLVIADSTSELPDEVAKALPLPAKAGSRLHVIILFYNEWPLPGKEVVYPPHHMMILDTATGKVIQFKACIPRDLGVNQQPNIAIEGFGLDPKMTANEFWAKLDRFLAISTIVWEAYATGSTQLGPQTRALVKEYEILFRQIAKRPLLPYYEAVASDFFDWLKKALR